MLSIIIANKDHIDDLKRCITSILEMSTYSNYEIIIAENNSTDPKIQDIMPYKRRNEIFKDKYFKLDESQICKTITSHMKFDCNMYIHPWEARGLSPREAARIQTFL